MEITFKLNGETVTLSNMPPTKTLLDWLRENKGLSGTKEGCNEGDCGACTVIVTDASESKPLNACILFLPQLDGKSVRTVEGVSGPDGELHPVQDAMIREHGSQCGFCTPGFITSMACAHLNGQTDYDDRLAGNLCRCTGYAPIIRAAQSAAAHPVPEWMHDTLPEKEVWNSAPRNSDQLADAFHAHPDALLIAGATDVALWVTKELRDLGKIIFLGQCEDLKEISISDTSIRAGAMVDMEQWRLALRDIHPSYAEMLRRYGSVQVRGAATLGGNIANGSPIGDNPPALIALGASIVLRHGDDVREFPIEGFFLEYGKQDRKPGEFVEAIHFPRQVDNLKVYKLSKRFDQDISAVCGAFNVSVSDGLVTEARIAFGGMAAIPKRAYAVEEALQDQPWTRDTIANALAAFEKDFVPLSDMRASAEYRLGSAKAMLQRFFAESQGEKTSVLEVTS